MIAPTPEQLAMFKRTPGAISVHEMLAIINVAAQAPHGCCAEMGSHRGKSGIAAAIGLQGKSLRELHMVDPLYDVSNLEAWSHSDQKHPDNGLPEARVDGFKESVKSSVQKATKLKCLPEDDLRCNVYPILHGDYSTNAIPRLHSEFGDFAYVFIDSDQHQYELVKEECELLRHRVAIGGIIAFHDFASQFHGVERAYREMLEGFAYEEIPVDWPAIKAWVSANGGEAGNNSWHHTDKEAPCFFGAIKRIK